MRCLSVLNPVSYTHLDVYKRQVYILHNYFDQSVLTHSRRIRRPLFSPFLNPVTHFFDIVPLCHPPRDGTVPLCRSIHSLSLIHI